MWYDDDMEQQISYYGTKNIFVYGVLYLIKYKLQNADTMTANFWIKTFLPIRNVEVDMPLKTLDNNIDISFCEQQFCQSIFYFKTFMQG